MQFTREQHYANLMGLVDKLPKSGSYDRFAALPPLPSSYTDTYDTPQNLLEYFSAQMVSDWSQVNTNDTELVASNEDGFSPEESVRVCLNDAVRTRRFIEAVIDGVQEKEKTVVGNRNIEVCDAGAGAFALLSIFAALTSPRVRVTAIELNETSAKIAGGIVKNMGLESQITIEVTDAKKHALPTAPDLLVTETMDRALLGEPIVQIMSNLVPQANKDAIIIPSKVDLHAALYPESSCDTAESMARQWPKVYSYTPGSETTTIGFEAKQVDGNFATKSESGIHPDSNSLAMLGCPTERIRTLLGLYARVRVGKRWLELNESDLTIIDVFTLEKHPGGSVDVNFSPGGSQLARPIHL